MYAVLIQTDWIRAVFNLSGFYWQSLIYILIHTLWSLFLDGLCRCITWIMSTKQRLSWRWGVAGPWAGHLAHSFWSFLPIAFDGTVGCFCLYRCEVLIGQWFQQSSLTSSFMQSRDPSLWSSSLNERPLNLGKESDDRLLFSEILPGGSVWVKGVSEAARDGGCITNYKPCHLEKNIALLLNRTISIPASLFLYKFIHVVYAGSPSYCVYRFWISCAYARGSRSDSNLYGSAAACWAFRP